MTNVVQFADYQKNKEPFYTQCTLIDDRLTVQVIDKKTGKLIFRHTFKETVKNARSMSCALFAVVDFMTEKCSKINIQ